MRTAAPADTEPIPWTTEPTLGYATHIMRTMSAYLAIAADDAGRADPPLDDRELVGLASSLAAVVGAVGGVVNLHADDPVLRVIEERSKS